MKPTFYAFMTLIGIFLVSVFGGLAASKTSKEYAQSFTDYEDAMRYLYERAVFDKIPEQLDFEKPLNRAELLKVLVKAKNVQIKEDLGDCFKDVKNEWYARYVCYGKNEGWIKGYSDGTFKPDVIVNKAEALKMLINSRGYAVNFSANYRIFDDENAEAWYAPYLDVAYTKGIFLNEGNNFAPSAAMTRGLMSMYIYRAMWIDEYGILLFRAKFSGMPSAYTYAQVERVIDGDTILLKNGERVRLLGIDAPELDAKECFSKESLVYLSAFLTGKEIILESDKLNANMDKYGRLLRYVYLKDDNINKMLISDGTEHFVDSLDERFGEFDKAKLFPVLKKTFVAIARKVKE